MLGRNGNIAYVRYDSQGRIVAGGPIIQAAPPKNGNWQAVSNVLGTNTTGTNGNILRAFIRIDMFGRVVPSSLVVQSKEPLDANSGTGWVELNTVYRGTTTTTTSSSSTSTTTTSSSTTTTTTTTTCYPLNNCYSGGTTTTATVMFGTTESNAINAGTPVSIRFNTCNDPYPNSFWYGQHILAGPDYCQSVPDGWYYYSGGTNYNVAQVIGGLVDDYTAYPYTTQIALGLGCATTSFTGRFVPAGTVLATGITLYNNVGLTSPISDGDYAEPPSFTTGGQRHWTVVGGNGTLTNQQYCPVKFNIYSDCQFGLSNVTIGAFQGGQGTLYEQAYPTDGTQLFLTEVDALAATYWVTDTYGSNISIIEFDYPGPAGGTYWTAIRDKNHPTNVTAKSVVTVVC